MPTRRLPAGVYWRRRVVVLLAAATAVFLLATWLTGGSDGADGDGQADVTAQVAGATVGTTPASGSTSSGATATGTAASTGTAKTRKNATPTLAAPTGTCAPEDVTVTPSVSSGVAGRDVALTLSLQTVTAEACTWQVSHDSIVVRIGQDRGQVWSTQQCPKVVTDQSVVVRKTQASVVQLTWNARKSAPGCRPDTQWMMPGDYTIAAAALGGEPAEADFTLARPVAPTVTVTPQQPRTTKLPKKPTN